MVKTKRSHPEPNEVYRGRGQLGHPWLSVCIEISAQKGNSSLWFKARECSVQVWKPTRTEHSRASNHGELFLFCAEIAMQTLNHGWRNWPLSPWTSLGSGYDPAIGLKKNEKRVEINRAISWHGNIQEVLGAGGCVGYFKPVCVRYVRLRTTWATSFLYQ